MAHSLDEGLRPARLRSAPKRIAATSFLVLALLMGVKAFYVVLQGGVVSGNEVTAAATNRSNLAYVALWSVLYLWSGAIVLYRTWTDGLDRRLLWLAPFGAYVIASACWSQAPSHRQSRPACWRSTW